VVVVVVVVIVIVRFAALSDCFQLVTAILGLTAMLAMLLDGLLQILFSFVDVTAAFVIGAGGHRHSRR
jgi:hypothetical protein